MTYLIEIWSYKIFFLIKISLWKSLILAWLGMPGEIITITFCDRRLEPKAIILPKCLQEEEDTLA